MLAERVRAGNRPWPLDLGSVCARYGLATKEPLIDALMRGGVCPSEMPEHLLRERAVRDVETTAELARLQMAALDADGQIEVAYTRCVLVPVLVEIEREGMTLDGERVQEEYARVARELGDTERALGELAGGINLRSPAQLAEFLYEKLGFSEIKTPSGKPKRNAPSKRFPDGAPKTDQKTLALLRARTKAQREFLELRKRYGKLDARMTKCLRFYKGVVDEYGGTFRAQFHQTRVATHRLSSTARPLYLAQFQEELGAQLQNQPREYKRLFTSPDPDYLVVEADGAQLEFRVAAFQGQDEVACRSIVRGEDVHRYSASVLLNKPESEVTDAERTAAKPETFKPLYGGEYGTDAQMAYYKAFNEKYAAIYRTQMGWVHEAVRDKVLRTPWGMRFYFPNARIDDRGRCADKPNIFNYPVQCLATAEIIPVSLTYLYWRCSLYGIRAKFVNTVHDSVVALVHKDDLERFKEQAKLAFLDDTYGYLEVVYKMEMNVPLGLGIKAGSHWGEGKEEKFSKPYKTVLAD